MKRPPYLRYDKSVDAAYIRLRRVPQAFSEMLDEDRIIDYTADGTPMGVELLNVSSGVSLDKLPEADCVERLLAEHGFRVLKTAS